MEVESGLLRVMWARNAREGARKYTTTSGSVVVVDSAGEYDKMTGTYRNAEINIDGVIVRGDVVFGECRNNSSSTYAVLQVVDRPSPYIMRYNGEPVPQIMVEIPEELQRVVNSLRIGAPRYECGTWLGDIPAAERISIFDDLLLERLERKCGDVMRIFYNSADNWGQTLYVMLFRTMGGNKNREPYMKLASLATYTMAMRERSSAEMLEALLLGTSGLLEGCYFDDYIHRLRDNFAYLRNKYQIQPMNHSEWDRAGINPRNNPVIRIVQLASFFANSDFVFDSLLDCRAGEDVQKVFSAEVSDYWTTHFVPDRSSARCPKRLGRDKVDLLGINLVVPMMFSYAQQNGKEALKEAAIDLLNSLTPENNMIVRGWTGVGVPVANAYDSQALIQLRNEYCERGRCGECKIGKRIIKNAVKAF